MSIQADVKAGGESQGTISRNYEGAADFNLDGRPDFLLFAPSTGQTAIWYLNNNVRIGSAFGPTPWAGWSLTAP